MSSRKLKIGAKAALYVRTATDDNNAVETQISLLQDYAARHKMEFIRTYIDAGVSGLRIEKQSALRQLIDAVQSGEADYEVIILKDVARWGRNPEDVIYCEQIFSRAGIAVRYVTDEFLNENNNTDESPVDTIIACLNRAMHHEYLREEIEKTAHE